MAQKLINKNCLPTAIVGTWVVFLKSYNKGLSSGTKIGKQFLFINFCATAIVGTWVVFLKSYNRGLRSTCPKPFSRSIFLRTEARWPALASQSEALKLKLSFLLQDNIFYKTLHVHMNIMITNFLFLLVAVLLFIFPLLNPRTSRHPNQIYASKRNLFMV